jgi:hypothetical protein
VRPLSDPTKSTKTSQCITKGITTLKHWNVLGKPGKSINNHIPSWGLIISFLQYIDKTHQKCSILTDSKIWLLSYNSATNRRRITPQHIFGSRWHHLIPHLMSDDLNTRPQNIASFSRWNYQGILLHSTFTRKAPIFYCRPAEVMSFKTEVIFPND